MFYLELSGKIVLITEGSDALGRASAERFINEGANVAICGRPSEYAKSVAAEIFAAAKGNNHNTSGNLLLLVQILQIHWIVKHWSTTLFQSLVVSKF